MLIERLDINRSDQREKLAQETEVRLIGSIPENFFHNAAVLVGNYIGEEEGPFLRPTVDGVVYCAYQLSTHARDGHNRLLAFTRSNLLATLPELYAKSIEPALVRVDKNRDGDYDLSMMQGIRVTRHLRRGGVVWIAPAATTRNDGFLLDIRTGSIRFARENKSSLGVLALETTGEGLNRRVNAIHIAEVSMPEINCLLKGDSGIALKREANYAIGIFSMAQAASLLPGDQNKGEYKDYIGIQERARFILWGLERKGLLATGGFLDEPIR